MTKFIKRKKLYNFFICTIGIAVAISVQILTMMPLGYTIVRVALADFIIPVAVVLTGAVFFSSEIRRPRWVVPNIDYALVGFFLFLGASSVIGLYRTGTFIAWAWGPKFIGFGLLLAYFLTGVLIAEAGKVTRKRVLFAYLCTSWLIAIGALARFFLEVNGLLMFGHMALRPVGLSNNPNAFAFLLGTAALVQILSPSHSSRLLKIIGVIGLSAIMTTLFLIASRSAYLGLVIALPFLVYFRTFLNFKIIFLAATLTPFFVYLVSINFNLFYGTLTEVDAAAVAAQQTISANPLSYALRNSAVIDTGVAARLETMRIALELWKASPVFGIGLGGFMHHYADITGGTVFAIHTTSLWLLVETGLVGVTYFAAIFVAFLWSNFRNAQSKIDELCPAIVVILVFSLGVSIGTEVMYQRQLWFLLGMTASLPSIWNRNIIK